MTEQYPGERFNNWNAPERTEETGATGLAVGTALAEDVPAEAAPVTEAPEAPVGWAPAAFGPTDNVTAEAAPVTEAPEAPVDWAQAAVAPIGETIVDEVPNPETMPDKAPEGEPVAEQSGVSQAMPYVAPTSEAITHEAPVATTPGLSGALFSREESERLRGRWNEIQGAFVDEPRAAVQQADALVSEAVEQLTRMFTTEHSSLESQWNRGDDVSTEDLRKALQHYRAFFNRLVV